MEEFEIDDFEKLYAITSAEINSSIGENGITYFDSDFDKISSLAFYRANNSKLPSDNYKDSTSKEANYYMIPVTVQQSVRNGKEELIISRKAHILTDPVGYSLFIVMDDGSLMQSAELKEQLRFAEDRYKTYLDKGVISKEEITNIFEAQSLDEAANLINEKDLRLSNVQNIVDEKMKEHGIVLPKENTNKSQEDKTELGEERLDPGEELERDEEKVKLEANSLGINVEMLEMLAKKYNCKINQLSFRVIDDYQRLQEDTGVDARMYRGNVIALRINLGFRRYHFIVNSETGEQLKLSRNPADIGNFPELEDYFRHPFARKEVDTAIPLSRDRVKDTSYITYLDENGKVKNARFINNGKEDDMLRDERERYIAEVEEADKILSSAIEVYQQDNTQENWLRVKDAMSKRIQIDKKYRVLENQKRNTGRTLYETIDETIEKYGMPKGKSKDDDEDEWFSRSRH